MEAEPALYELGLGSDPYDAGVSAWLSGLSGAENPYPLESEAFEDWKCGFDDAACEEDEDVIEADKVEAGFDGRGSSMMRD